MKYIASFLFLLLLTFNASAHQAAEQDHVKVVGVGEVEKEPDIATLNISIEAKEADMLTAKKVADDKYRIVLDVIQKAGIDDKDIKATRINAQPVYECKTMHASIKVNSCPAHWLLPLMILIRFLS